MVINNNALRLTSFSDSLYRHLTAIHFVSELNGISSMRTYSSLIRTKPSCKLRNDKEII